MYIRGKIIITRGRTLLSGLPCAEGEKYEMETGVRDAGGATSKRERERKEEGESSPSSVFIYVRVRAICTCLHVPRLFPRAYHSRTVRFIDDADGPEKEKRHKKKTTP